MQKPYGDYDFDPTRIVSEAHVYISGKAAAVAT